MNTRTKRRKILYLITKSNWGGAQRYVFDLATHMQQEEFEVMVALGGTGIPNAETGKLKDKLDHAHIKTHAITSFARDIFIFRDIQSFFKILSILRKECPDILHTNSSKAGGLGALAGRILGIPHIIFTSHGLAFEEPRPELARKIIRFFTWLTCALSHAVIALSVEAQNQLREMPLLSQKIHLIPNGLPEISFVSRREARKHLQKYTGTKLPRTVPWILTIAELTANKGIEYALHAASILKSQEQDFLYLIIGDGEHKEKLENLVKKYDLATTVKLLGFVSDASYYLKACDIFLLPSLKEGHPYVLLEAAQAKLPVVGSDIAGIRTFLKHENTGLLVLPQDAQGIATALSQLINSTDKRERLGKNLRIHTGEHFSFAHMCEKTKQVYNLNS